MPVDQTPHDVFLSVRVLTMRQLRELVPYTPQHIYRLEAAGKFPKRVKIGANRVGWRHVDIHRWLGDRPTVETPPAPNDEHSAL